MTDTKAVEMVVNPYIGSLEETPSVVRWLTIPDTWNFTRDIEPDAINPNDGLIDHLGVAIWDVEGDTWGHNVYSQVTYKHFLQAGDKVYALDENGNLIQPIGGASPTEEDYLAKGMDNFQGLLTPRTRVNYKMEENIRVGEGMEFTKKVSPAEFKRRIKKMKVELPE